MEIFFIVLISVCIIILNIIWFKIKFILKKENYSVNYFIQHLTDIPNFFNLIGKEIDMKKKRYYIKLVLTMFLFILLSMISFIFFIKWIG